MRLVSIVPGPGPAVSQEAAVWNTRYDFNRRKQSEEFQLCKSLVIKLSSD